MTNFYTRKSWVIDRICVALEETIDYILSSGDCAAADSNIAPAISLHCNLRLKFLLAVQHSHSIIPPLWSRGQSSWPQTQKSRVRFPELRDILSINRSGTGSTQPCEHKWGATWMRCSCSDLKKLRLSAVDGSVALTTRHPSIHKSWH
jgi:hypothetical protein